MPEEKRSTTLPSISNLFSDSWEMFKGSILNLFILSIISFVIYTVLFITAVIIALPLGAFSIFSAIQENQLSPAFFTSLGGIGIVAVLFLVGLVIVGLMVQAAMYIIISNYKKAPSFGQALKQGLHFVFPLFIASIVIGFLVMGGYFLFIIPGIFFAILFSFTFYEIVLAKKGILAAARGSVAIVSSNFWGIFARILLWAVIVIIASILPQTMINSDNPGLIFPFVFISFIINILLSWYGVCYTITLYNQAKDAADSKKGHLRWVLLTSVIGWIVGILLIGSLIALITTLVQNSMMQQNTKQQLETFQQLQDPAVQRALENPTEENVRAVLDLLPTNSPQRAQLEAELEEYYMQYEDGMMMQGANGTNGYMMMPTGTESQ